MRSLALGNNTIPGLHKRSTLPVEAGSVTLCSTGHLVGVDADIQEQPRLSHNCSMPQQIAESETAEAVPRKQILNSVASFVHETRSAVMSRDPLSHQHLAQIYRELGEQRAQLQEIRRLIEKPQDHGKREAVASCGNIQGLLRPTGPDSGELTGNDQDTSTADIFLGCVSRFSSNDSTSSIQRLRKNFTGAIDYSFESGPSFYPERYTTDSLLSESIFVTAMKQSEDNLQVQQYYLMYAENPRRWRRLIVSAHFNNIQQASAISEVSAPDTLEGNCKTLPKATQQLLHIILPEAELCESVTSISVFLTEGESGLITPDLPAIEVAANSSEDMTSDEAQILQDIEDLGCPRFSESEIVTVSRISCSCFEVWVKRRTCVERKVSFATAGMPGENGFQDFIDDLKVLSSLSGCARVNEFVGVVLDDTGRHLRSYLYERPLIPSMEILLATANNRSEDIPWAVRETWALQIIMAISEMHSKGIVVGLMSLHWIGIRADGTAILHGLKSSQRHLENRKGEMPPEMRSGNERGMNFRTDIFQLGLLLWLLAEHAASPIGYFCAKVACTSRPRFSCNASHANPVELLPCKESVPSYFNSIIRRCRLSDPKARPSARKLLEDLQHMEIWDNHVPDMDKLLADLSPLDDGFALNCDNCGALNLGTHYHCNVCHSGDFDICLACFADGIRCFVREHRLMKRVKRNGSFVDIS